MPTSLLRAGLHTSPREYPPLAGVCVDIAGRPLTQTDAPPLSQPLQRHHPGLVDMLDVRDVRSGFTALGWACNSGASEATRLLLEASIGMVHLSTAQ